MQIETDRLILRPFENGDASAVIAMNADPRVMRYFPSVLTPEESRARLEQWIAKEARLGMRPAPDLAFGFPSIPADNPLHPAVVYRLRAEDWRAQQVRG